MVPVILSASLSVNISVVYHKTSVKSIRIRIFFSVIQYAVSATLSEPITHIITLDNSSGSAQRTLARMRLYDRQTLSGSAICIRKHLFPESTDVGLWKLQIAGEVTVDPAETVHDREEIVQHGRVRLNHLTEFLCVADVPKCDDGKKKIAAVPFFEEFVW